jgi:hypothetical protein
MSVTENPMSLLSFDQNPSVEGFPNFKGYVTPSNMPISLPSAIPTSFQSVPTSLPTSSSRALFSPPSYRDSNLYGGKQVSSNVALAGLPIIHILNQQALPRSQWVGSGNTIPQIPGPEPEGLTVHKVLMIIAIIIVILIVIWVVSLFFKDAKRGQKATTGGSKIQKPASSTTPLTSLTKVEPEPSPPKPVGAFSRLLRPTVQTGTTTASVGSSTTQSTVNGVTTEVKDEIETFTSEAGNLLRTGASDGSKMLGMINADGTAFLAAGTSDASQLLSTITADSNALLSAGASDASQLLSAMTADASTLLTTATALSKDIGSTNIVTDVTQLVNNVKSGNASSITSSATNVLGDLSKISTQLATGSKAATTNSTPPSSSS